MAGNYELPANTNTAEVPAMSETIYTEMTLEHLGPNAEPNDLLDFQAACEAVLPAFDGDAEAATDYIWNNGDFGPQLTAGACIYCGRLTADRTIVPASGDDEGWADLATEHEADCEWLATRAHQRAN